jgi:pantothenate kinase
VPLEENLLTRARSLTADGRAVLGICGAPGAGKSTVAAELVAAYGEEAVVVPMDGFHLHDDELARLGLSDRKGAPETFDVAGYVALLARLRAEPGTTVYAPEFVRAMELSVAGAIAVRPEHRLVVTEGNYLLHWPEVRPLLDEVWYLDPDPADRLAALIARHVAFGRSAEQAREWVLRSDERNARLIARDRELADRRLDWGSW